MSVPKAIWIVAYECRKQWNEKGLVIPAFFNHALRGWLIMLRFNPLNTIPVLGSPHSSYASLLIGQGCLGLSLLGTNTQAIALVGSYLEVFPTQF